jgi:hypothetical protein
MQTNMRKFYGQNFIKISEQVTIISNIRTWEDAFIAKIHAGVVGKI